MARAKPGRDAVPKPVAARLPLYLRTLERLHARGTATISSRQLGRAVGCTAAQVRKDLAYFGQFGRQGVGYPVIGLSKSLRRILGTHRVWRAALVGVGNLGSALLAYKGFAERGFEIAAAFDADKSRQGRTVKGVRVRPPRLFTGVVRRKAIALGIIAVNVDSAQSVADMMVEAGVKGILNFAPVQIRVPEEVVVYSVDMAVKLEQITYQLISAEG